MLKATFPKSFAISDEWKSKLKASGSRKETETLSHIKGGQGEASSLWSERSQVSRRRFCAPLVPAAQTRGSLHAAGPGSLSGLRGEASRGMLLGSPGDCRVCQGQRIPKEGLERS